MGRGELPWRKWLDDFPTASAWLEKHGDIQRAVEKAGGLLRIDNFLPESVAAGILSVLQAVPEAAWNDTSAKEDYRQNNISHSFSSVKNAKGLDAVVRLFSLIIPESLNAFSAARYCKSDHIAPHDDRAYTKVQLDNGRIITTSRTLAVIYYLTRDWKEEYGGVLLDLEDPSCPGGRKYVPRWNSVVAFRVPRYHAVTALTANRPRYSIFGWFLEPGKLYPLYQGEEGTRAKQALDTLGRQATQRQQDRQDQQRRQQEGTQQASAAAAVARASVAAPHRRGGVVDASSGDGTAVAGDAAAAAEASGRSGGGKRRLDADTAESAAGGGAGHGVHVRGDKRRRTQQEVQEGEQHGRGGQASGRTRDEAEGGQDGAIAQPGSGTSRAQAARAGAAGDRAQHMAMGARSRGRAEGHGGCRGGGQQGVRLPGRWQGRRKHVCV